MLSDKLQHVKSPKKQKKEDGVRRWYSDSEKFEAVKLWLITGNMPVVAAALNIPLPTLKQWRYSKWWDEVVSELRSESSIKLSSKLREIASKALDITMDRLENGDFVYNQKTGEIIRKPVVMRDAVQVANSLLDKQLKIDSKPMEEAAQQKVQERLGSLAEAFSKLAKKTHSVEVIDAI